ncbi:DUF2231 domain-containing protein [Mycobacterium sp. SM1]|uniref:DUF2231 domain-containing protein n=1 Tax=Mycobacterium sp. SM1 TaxID=2816243 RepID=UPI001BCE5B67|nr:DUF2231 domain-containing protein [Mycobacterium sp. SM1]MBS4727964.1 DUF2231 domain-containing protein [Mycobacterium sp. SM1]
MTTRLHDAKRPVSTVLAGPYGHPFHPVLVTIPIGAWACSLIFDVSSRVVDNAGFLAQGSEWLLAIGILGAFAAAMIGFLDLVVIPSGTPAFRTGVAHMTMNLLITTAYMVNFVWRRGDYGTGAPVGVGPLVLNALGFSGLAVSGYLGGKLAYRYGVRVAGEADQAQGFTTAG